MRKTLGMDLSQSHHLAPGYLRQTAQGSRLLQMSRSSYLQYQPILTLCSITCVNTKFTKALDGTSLLLRVGMLGTSSDICTSSYHIKGRRFYQVYTGRTGKRW